MSWVTSVSGSAVVIELPLQPVGSGAMIPRIAEVTGFETFAHEYDDETRARNVW
jgi:hypothetical protein